jgi:hypothetical protein
MSDKKNLAQSNGEMNSVFMMAMRTGTSVWIEVGYKAQWRVRY